MGFRAKLTWLGVAAVILLSAGQSRAGEKQVVAQIKKELAAAQSAYSDGEMGQMKAHVQKAVALGEKNGLEDNDVMADTYLLVAIVQVDLDKHDAAVEYFAKALKIRSDLDLPDEMATKDVRSAWKEAKAGGGGGEKSAVAAKDEDKPAGKADAKADKAEKAEKAEKTVAKDEEEEEEAAPPEPKKSAKEIAAEKKRAAAEAKEQERLAKEEERQRAKEEKETARLEAQRIKEEKADQAARDKAAQAEKDKLEKQLADSKKASDKELADREKALAATKTKADQLEKDKADKEKALADATNKVKELEKDKADRDKQLTAAADREKKEREAKEKLQADKAAVDKQLADAKARIQQLEKEKADRDKELTATATREKQEKEAKEKLQKEKELADAREKARLDKEMSERQEKEKLALGPDLPSSFSEQIHCEIPDEVASGEDLYVHCAPQSGVKAKAKSVAFYYRPTGNAHFNSVVMQQNKKGWYMTVVPADFVRGKALQYYAEARDGKDGLVAANGKANSPNIATIVPGAKPAAAKSAPAKTANSAAGRRARAKGR